MVNQHISNGFRIQNAQSLHSSLQNQPIALSQLSEFPQILSGMNQQGGSSLPFAIWPQNMLGMFQGPCFQQPKLPFVLGMRSPLFQGNVGGGVHQINSQAQSRRSSGDGEAHGQVQNSSFCLPNAPIGLPEYQNIGSSWNLMSKKEMPIQHLPSSFHGNEKETGCLGSPAVLEIPILSREVSADVRNPSLQKMYQSILNYVNNIIRFKTQEMVKLLQLSFTMFSESSS